MKAMAAICAGCLITTPCSSNMIGPFQSSHKISAEITPAKRDKPAKPSVPKKDKTIYKFKSRYKYRQDEEMQEWL